MLVAASIVTYSNSSFMNASIEKKLASISLKRSSSLEEAIGWVQQLSELS